MSDECPAALSGLRDATLRPVHGSQLARNSPRADRDAATRTLLV